MSKWNGALADQLGEMVARVQRSLVIVQSQRNGAGAGIVWHADGLVLTNNHVLMGKDRAHITLADDRVIEGRLLARDPEIDLALLQIQAEGLEALPLGDSQAARVGQMAFAIGHPWGQRASATAGIISALPTLRTRGRRGQVPVIRIDAQLAPGNSGGPLVNAAGELLGINTMIIGGDQGVAIPSATALEFVNEAIKKRNPDYQEAVI